jgi:pyruvate kinase
MALFRRKGPEIVRKSSASGAVEEHKTVLVRGQKVEMRRVEGPAPDKTKKEKRDRKGSKGKKPSSSSTRNGIATSRTRSRRPVDDEIIVPTESARKQMLVSANRSQTQIVILEGPVLVEHYVT